MPHLRRATVEYEEPTDLLEVLRQDQDSFVRLLIDGPYKIVECRLVDPGEELLIWDHYYIGDTYKRFSREEVDERILRAGFAGEYPVTVRGGKFIRPSDGDLQMMVYGRYYTLLPPTIIYYALFNVRLNLWEFSCYICVPKREHYGSMLAHMLTPPRVRIGQNAVALPRY